MEQGREEEEGTRLSAVQLRLYQHNKKSYNKCTYVCAVILQILIEDHQLMGSYTPGL